MPHVLSLCLSVSFLFSVRILSLSLSLICWFYCSNFLCYFSFFFHFLLLCFSCRNVLFVTGFSFHTHTHIHIGNVTHYSSRKSTGAYFIECTFFGFVSLFFVSFSFVFFFVRFVWFVLFCVSFSISITMFLLSLILLPSCISISYPLSSLTPSLCLYLSIYLSRSIFSLLC